MKPFSVVTLFLILGLLLTACGGPQYSNSGDSELRAATPGVVDHNVIPKKHKK